MDVQNEGESSLLNSHQNIIVEVPIINGDPPAMLNVTSDMNESHLLITERTCGDVVQEEHVESNICKQDGDTLSLQKEEQLRRRREQNRFRMRALRASDSEVAKRLREHNKFRMRTLRASDSLVAQGLRERNKHRMREVRMAESKFIDKCVSVEGCVKKISITDSKDIYISDLNPHKKDIKLNMNLNPRKEDIKLNINLNAELNKLAWTCLEADQIAMQDPFLGALCSRKQDEDRELESSTSCESRDQLEQVCCDPKSRTDSYSCSLILKGDLTVADAKTNDRTVSFQEESTINPVECSGFALESADAVTSICIGEVDGRETLAKDDVLGTFQTQYHRIQVMEIMQSKGGNFSHLLKLREVENQNKVYVGMPASTSHHILPDIEEQIRRRRERGKLRMRLKRNAETEEEAQKRRERGRLRMRVLRASETEEQAARRRELNRLRMRMMRNTARQ